jgi:hypothetical protein
MKIAAIGVLLTAVGGSAVMSQGLSFDVASIKINRSGDPGERMNTLAGRVIAQNTT